MTLARIKTILRSLLTSRVVLPRDPIPDSWHRILDERVPLSRALNDQDRLRLLRITQLFLRDVPLEGCGGLVVNDEMRIAIGATASLLLLNLPYPKFPRLQRVLLYPDTFVPVRVQSHRAMSADSEPEPTLGEAWHHGMIVLSWQAILQGARAADGHNVVLHEFAHVLDFEDGSADGRPLLGSAEAIATWSAVLEREFSKHQTDAYEAETPALDPYGAKNRAEFFAVATEAFFEAGPRLREELPDLYDLLHRYYHQDPASTAERGAA